MLSVIMLGCGILGFFLTAILLTCCNLFRILG